MTVHLTVLPGGRDDTWWDRAACAGIDADLFHPGQGESDKQAKQVCNSCPVRLQCLEYALDRPERHGVWGGKSARERERMRARRRVGGAA